MPELLSALRSLNRKERYLLLQWVLDRPGFPLGDAFRMKLEEACEVDLSGEAVVAMDYHLDWLYAALRWARDDLVPGQELPRDDGDDPPRLITGSQEDVDLLVAIAGPKGTTTLLLCEAKAYSPKDDAQLRHKVERLRAILGEDGQSFPGVVPRFVLLGPKPPAAGITKGWPAWMTRTDSSPYFVPLPAPEGRYSIHRENATDWSWWKIVPAPWND
jgi:hypothetical protein